MNHTTYNKISLSPSQIISIWEQGNAQHPIDRALTILAQAIPEMTSNQLEDLPIGIRNAHLLTIYEHTFGRSLDGLATCPECRKMLEFSISISVMLNHTNSGTKDLDVLDTDSHRVEFRLPNSRDLAAIVRNESVTSARMLLLDRCVLSATTHGTTVGAATLPEIVIDELSDKISACDPHADLVLDLNCQACTYRWQSSLDIVSFLWEKISARVRTLLYEIHTLASAYGWSEEAILSLGPVRRYHYMEMVL